jgi:hypothetical protein
MRTFEWPIEEIATAHPGLYLDHCVVMAVAIMRRLSASPCEFLVDCEGFRAPNLEGEPRFLLHVSWEKQTAQEAKRVWRTEQPKPIVERTAVALAALVYAHLIPGGRLRVTNQGEKAALWLPRLRCALEISGTRRRDELPGRHREKVAQVLANPRKWDGFVFIGCFDTAHRLIRWSCHLREEREHAQS